ncbi:MAG: hypothetical protein PWP51_244 [Clostridiales bacterium]|jgi:uncharacterized protein (DUF2164 family)|nr:hypothetical protein [Clostridiales bacterium]MDN5297691.1 hypothetical protein [Clostridiales bacterium]
MRDLYGVQLDDATRKTIILAFQDFYENETGETLGMFQAEAMVDFMIERIGPNAYNLALDHVRGWHRKKMEDMDLEYDMLYRNTR